MTPAANAAVGAAVAKLQDAGVPTETRVTTLRGAFGRTKVRAVGEVWRLGALCIAPDGSVFATGDVLVVGEASHPNFRSQLAVDRNELRAQSRRAGIPVGATAVIDPRPLDLAVLDSPLVTTADGIGVVWTVGGGIIPLDAYLTERVDLLVNRPEGA